VGCGLRTPQKVPCLSQKTTLPIHPIITLLPIPTLGCRPCRRLSASCCTLMARPVEAILTNSGKLACVPNTRHACANAGPSPTRQNLTDRSSIALSVAATNQPSIYTPPPLLRNRNSACSPSMHCQLSVPTLFTHAAQIVVSLFATPSQLHCTCGWASTRQVVNFCNVPTAAATESPLAASAFQNFANHLSLMLPNDVFCSS